jgi:putative tryptophan/tyrosine transport system substrate-binding protein
VGVAGRRRFLIAAGSFAVAPSIAFGQQQVPIRRIGFLAVRARVSGRTLDPGYASFIKAMRERGWIEGKNLLIEWRYANGDYARLPKLAAELVQTGVEVLVTHSTVGTEAAREATGTIPIVTAAVSDAVSSGFAGTLGRPGRNITGLNNVSIELVPKQLEILKVLMPGLKTVGFLLNPGAAVNIAALEDLQTASARLRVKVLRFDARSSEDITTRFEMMRGQHVQAIIIANDAFLSGQRRQISDLSIKHRIPAIFPYREHVVEGGLMSYGESISDIWSETAGYVDKILKGAKPEDLPFERPTKLRLTINRKTAKALGLTVPRELLERADELIE